MNFVHKPQRRTNMQPHRDRCASPSDIPTVAESAIPGFDTGSWVGVLTPAGTPTGIIEKISSDLNAVLAQPDTRDTLINQGATPLPLTTASFIARIDSDRKRYGAIITANGIRVD